MTPCVTLRKPRSLALAVGLTLALGLFAKSSFAAEDAAITDANADIAPAGDLASMRPAAKFFSINAVLAKLDRQRSQGTEADRSDKSRPEAVRLAALTPANTATDAPPSINAVPSIGQEPFGLFTFRAPEGLLWRKWRGVEADLVKEQAVLDQCRADAATCPSYAAQFLRLINVVSSKSGRERLDEANRGVNAAIRYVSDISQHGELDRWTTPLATYATAKGDCEDYAIAKYAALVASGFSRDDLQLVLVRDRAVRQDHAVLAARLDGRWLILDNRFSTLTEDSEATRFTPLFAINHHGVHLFAAPYARRPLLTNEVEAAPASAANGAGGEWAGMDDAGYGAAQAGTMTLLM